MSEKLEDLSHLPLWEQVWHKAVGPMLSDEALEALKRGLMVNDARLIQGATTTPPPLQCVQDWPVEAACALGFCGWLGDGLETVGEVEQFFARMCFEIDQCLGEPAGCRHFLDWVDSTPREEMRRELLKAVDSEMGRRLLETAFDRVQY